MTPVALAALVFSIVAILFGISRIADKKDGWIDSSLVSALTWGLYCTSWTFLGSLGSVVVSGPLFLSIYLGPMAVMVFLPSWIEKLVYLRDRLGITNLIDLLVVRYQGSRSIGVIGALFLVMGLIPYIALQMKSIFQTAEILVGQTIDRSTVGLAGVFVIWVVTILFGLNRLDSREQHRGLMLSVSIEAVVKVLAVVAVGIWSLGKLESSFFEYPALTRYLTEQATDGKVVTPQVSSWIVWMLLAAVAFVFLPRQYQVLVVEKQKSQCPRRARFYFSIYLLLAIVFVLPIANLGLELGYPDSQADVYTLILPLKDGNTGLATLVFIGGFFAGLGMIMIETMALSQIVSNNVIAPLIARYPSWAWAKGSLLHMRQAIAGVILIFALAYKVAMGNSYALGAMGLISFAAILIFLVPVLAAFVWRGSSRLGVLLALLFSGSAWMYLLFIPAFVRSGLVLDLEFLSQGPAGISWLSPNGFLGFQAPGPLEQSVVWSLFFGVAGMLLGSILRPPSGAEQLMAEQFLSLDQSADRVAGHRKNGVIDLSLKNQKLRVELDHYFSSQHSAEVIDEVLSVCGLKEQSKINLFELADYNREMLGRLSGSLGVVAAQDVLNISELFTKSEEKQLEEFYLDLLREYQMRPHELHQKLMTEIERAEIAKKHNLELERTVDRVTQELESEKQKSVYSAKMSALGEMAAGIAHEINNPLTIIDGHLWKVTRLVSKSTFESRDETLKVIQKASAAIVRIAKIIRGLRSFARDAENDPYEMVSLGQLIDDSLDLTRSKLDNANIVVRVNNEHPAKLVEVQQVQIVQVIVNLLMNARDAVAPLPERWITVRVKLDESTFEVQIIDSGFGIPAEVVDKIMNPFFTTKPVDKGTGLGLSISKGIAEKHGGSLVYQLVEGHTAFCLRVPIKQPE